MSDIHGSPRPRRSQCLCSNLSPSDPGDRCSTRWSCPEAAARGSGHRAGATGRSSFSHWLARPACFSRPSTGSKVLSPQSRPGSSPTPFRLKQRGGKSATSVAKPLNIGGQNVSHRYVSARYAPYRIVSPLSETARYAGS